MSRRMSCALTVDAVRARMKTVTRRDVTTWAALKPGDRLTLIEKGMGLKRGERQVILAEVEVVDVRVEPLSLVDDMDVAREGFSGRSALWFVSFWLASHGHKLPPGIPLGEVKAWAFQQALTVTVRRIEWRYLP